jgi:L-amino acid N-acyltransferase YncA
MDIRPTSAQPSIMRIRAAAPRDAEAVAAIYNEGIEERVATFETSPRSAADMAARFGSTRHPFLVAERDGRVLGFAAVAPYSAREAYSGVGEPMVYVARPARGSGLGAALLEELVAAAERRGFHKLVGKAFPENAASRALVRRCGFREVGIHNRHARLDGRWRDVVVVERLLGDAAL